MNKYIKLLYEVSLGCKRSLKEFTFDPSTNVWYQDAYFEDLINGQQVVDNMIQEMLDERKYKRNI